MDFTTDRVHFEPYGPDRFPERSPYARRGYLFTVPGTFPADTPSHTNVTDQEMTVYRAHGGWEVRDTSAHAKAWGTGPSRRVAVGLALQEIARVRRARAADITEKRVNVLGLESVPPFQVETAASVTLVLTRDAIGSLMKIEPGTPATYRVADVDTGATRTVPGGGQVTFHTVTVGVLHERCTCNPDHALQFENEPDAVRYIGEYLTVCWPCNGLAR